MNFLRTSLPLALSLLLLASPTSWAVDATRNAAPNVPANRIVGLWSTDALISPCGSGFPPSPLRNTLLFSAGGTVVENPLFPPAGVSGAFGVPGTNQRGQALGTWSLNPVSNQYSVHLRFDWFVNDAYHGYQTVDRELTLSADGNEATGPVQSTRYAANGSVIVMVCGAAVSQRL